MGGMWASKGACGEKTVQQLFILDNYTCVRQTKERRTKTEGQEEILAATGPQKQKP